MPSLLEAIYKKYGHHEVLSADDGNDGSDFVIFIPKIDPRKRNREILVSL